MGNISLIGFMGSGKSEIAKELAEKLNKKFLDIDELIEAVEAESIFNIIKEKGENYFRELESEVIRKVFINDGYIFACGGGVIEREENVKIIRKRSKVIYLYISPQTAYKRLIGVKNRPLLDVEDRKEKISMLMKLREIKYRKAADIVVDNNGYKKDTLEGIIQKL